MKKCNKCLELLDDSLFIKKKKTCDICAEIQLKEYNKNYYLNNTDKIKQQAAKNYENNKSNILAQAKLEYSENKEKFIEKNKALHTKNKDKYNAQKRLYYKNNAEKFKCLSKKYRIKNRELARKWGKEWEIKRKHNDPSYKLRKNISKLVYYYLCKNGYSKNGISIMSKLNYSFQELKKYLESKFEPWMNWNNYGMYRLDTWDDNDQSTWTWNIDHIIPQSKLLYTSMEDDNFKKCWALDNLQPLSSKDNLMKGAK